MPPKKAKIKANARQTLIAPIDAFCPLQFKAHVYSIGSEIYDVMLNQTNIGNNNNKYFIIQLLESISSPSSYWVWLRWGRVGYKGQTNLLSFDKKIDDAIDTFKKKFSDKTKNDWEDKDKFVKVAGKYDLVKIDYTIKEEPKLEPKLKKLKMLESQLCQELRDLIMLISNVREMEDAVSAFDYDFNKAPLGRLTKEQIKMGYLKLKLIENLIDKNTFGDKLVDACSDYYTCIPHNFGMRRPTLINSKHIVQAEVSLLEALGDIEIALRLIRESENEKQEHPIDAKYHSLKCQINLLDRNSKDFKMIDDYLQKTHAPTHQQYKLSILNVFEVQREGENEKYVDYGNKMLLWHGSRLTNYMGILSQGLRIAPPEAPVTGYMFGKGIYFADMSSKSANYCCASRKKPTGLMLLSEVSLGSVNKLVNADSNAHKLPEGKQSVMGLGSTVPSENLHIKWRDDVVVPIGVPTNATANNECPYSLNYNEYIVYNPAQVRLRYLLQLEFKYEK